MKVRLNTDEHQITYVALYNYRDVLKRRIADVGDEDGWDVKALAVVQRLLAEWGGRAEDET